MKDIIEKQQDLRYLDWTERKLSPGTPGCFLKAYYETDGIRTYYKLSNYDSYRGIYGHESVNELAASRLLDILNIPHVSYQLIHAWIQINGQEFKTWICASDNFRKPDEEKIAFDLFYDLEREKNEAPLEFVKRYGWEQYVYRMMLVDYLIANRDRHGGNIEVLRNLKTEKARLSPLFDHGVSLLFSCYANLEEIVNFDVMQDIQANNYFGSRSLRYNLGLIPNDCYLNLHFLRETDKHKLLSGLDKVLPAQHIEKIWEMIWKRWCCYETLCGKK